MNELPTTFDAVLTAENDGYHALITLLHWQQGAALSLAPEGPASIQVRQDT